MPGCSPVFSGNLKCSAFFSYMPFRLLSKVFSILEPEVGVIFMISLPLSGGKLGNGIPKVCFKWVQKYRFQCIKVTGKDC